MARWRTSISDDRGTDTSWPSTTPSVRRLSLTRWRSPHADAGSTSRPSREQAGGEGGVDVVLDADRRRRRTTTRRARRRSGTASPNGLGGAPATLSVRSKAARETSSKALSAPGRRRSRVASNSTTRSVSSTASHHVCVDRGSGNEIDDRPGDHTQRAPGADRRAGLRRGPGCPCAVHASEPNTDASSSAATTSAASTYRRIAP